MKNRINLIAKINRCGVKIEISQRSNNDPPLSPIERHRKDEIKLIEEYAVRRLQISKSSSLRFNRIARLDKTFPVRVFISRSVKNPRRADRFCPHYRTREERRKENRTGSDSSALLSQLETPPSFSSLSLNFPWLYNDRRWYTIT